MELEREILSLVSCDIDDESPQILAIVQDRALALGALDCVILGSHMKKGRTGARVEILCTTSAREEFRDFLLLETSTLGVRIVEVERWALPRRVVMSELRGFPVRFKIALIDGRILRATPEFEDVRRLAERDGVPVREILREAHQLADTLHPPGGEPQ